MINIIQGISDAIADRSDLDMTQHMLIGLDNWPIGYRIGYRFFCQRGEIKGDSYASFSCLALLSVLLMFLAAIFM